MDWKQSPICLNDDVCETDDPNDNHTVGIVSADNIETIIESQQQLDSKNDFSDVTAPPPPPEHIDLVPVESARPSSRIVRASPSWADVGWTVLAKTTKVIAKSMDFANGIIYSCIIPLDNVALTNEEIAETEDNISVKFMKMLGVSPVARHRIYTGAADNISILVDLSVGTYSILSSLVMWAFDTPGGNEIREQSQMFAATQTEVDPSNEVWSDLKDEMNIYTQALSNAVREGFDKVAEVTRQCSRTLIDAFMSNNSDMSRPASARASIQSGVSGAIVTRKNKVIALPSGTLDSPISPPRTPPIQHVHRPVAAAHSLPNTNRRNQNVSRVAGYTEVSLDSDGSDSESNEQEPQDPTVTESGSVWLKAMNLSTQYKSEYELPESLLPPHVAMSEGSLRRLSS